MRKPKYPFKPEYIEQLRRHMANNQPFKTFNETIGCSYSTVFRWTISQKEFEAVRLQFQRESELREMRDWGFRGK